MVDNFGKGELHSPDSKHMKNTQIKISPYPLFQSECIAFVEDDTCGAINTFIGIVRNQTKDKQVIRLEFEAYEKMAVNEMQKITAQALKKFDIHKISMHHRIGVLDIGEVPVIIAVSSAHRKAGFDACAFAIDTLKETVPIWKKEIYEDGSIWVSAHP